MADIQAKMKEAKFFLELLEALEKRVDSLTNLESPSEEASFLLSAISNAFYSALDQWRKQNKSRQSQYQEFARRYPEIYGSDRQGGWRNTTVHVSHVQVSTAGYIPPPGNSVNFDFRDEPKLGPHYAPGACNIRLGPQFYFSHGGKEIHALEFCYEHFYALQKFITEQGAA
ncbi:hypothetical protein [Marinobacter sp.]|uniref:hypothetical protein n=1 Tax=Marinobacter sp. TaxID=50741 RepID=UPI003A9031ED